jgi:uncharacterized membrane protein YbhN (UPF0104 family)
MTLGLSLLLVIYLCVIRSGHPRTQIVTRLRALSLHHAHSRAEPSDIVVILALKLAYSGVFVALYYWGAPAFGIELPLALVVASVPIIQGIGALPISPAGLGTQQAAMLFFFSGHGSDAAIMAFGLLLPASTIALRCLIGWPYLRRLTNADRSLPTGNAQIAID